MKIGSARMVLYLAAGLFVVGTMMHGIAWSEFQRIWQHIIERPSGALSLRFLLQPTMSSIFALRDGIKDARTGRSPYFWTVMSDPQKRSDRLIEGLDSTGKIILIAIVLDSVYQYISYKTFYPTEALLVAFFLGFIPYLLLRGPFERVARWWMGRETHNTAP